MSKQELLDVFGFDDDEDFESLSEFSANLPVVVPEEAQVVTGEVEETEYSFPDPEVNPDLEMARDVMRDILTKAKDVVAKQLQVIDQAPTARDVEVFSFLLNGVTNASKGLVELRKKSLLPTEKKEKVKELPTTVVPATVNNNNVFVGTTAELAKLMNKDSGEKKLPKHHMKKEETHDADSE